MGFLKHYYVGPKRIEMIDSTNDTIDQIWQQLTILRHVAASRPVYGKEASYSLMDQAKVYFLDARYANWKSGGLLYYYSFLNLAKALLLARGVYSDLVVKSDSLFHGLSADPQSPGEIIDFEFRVSPKMKNEKQNVFAALYESVIGKPWPFADIVTLKIGSILPYCHMIFTEIFDFYGLNRALVQTQSLVRTSDDKSQSWFEFLVPRTYGSSIIAEIPGSPFSVVDSMAFTESDRDDWFRAYDKTNALLNQMVLIRSSLRTLSPQGAASFRDIEQTLEHYALPSPEYVHLDEWIFVSKLGLNGQSLHWHPLLSDYLFSFVISTILRYYPHLVPNNGRDAYISEAWCKQSAQMALRYFLLEFTDPGLVIRQV